MKVLHKAKGVKVVVFDNTQDEAHKKPLKFNKEEMDFYFDFLTP